MSEATDAAWPALAAVPVAILAGGRATRLGTLAAERPKSLVPIGDRPFVDWQLALLQRRGVRRVLFFVGHLAEQIVAHVGDGARYGLSVEYVHDGPRALGTAGALRQAIERLVPLCWVLYGDSYLDFDYAAALAHFYARPEPAMMTVYRNEGRWDTSNVEYADGRVRRYDKRQPDPAMAWIDYGATLLRQAALERVPPDTPFDLAELYTPLAAGGLLAGYPVAERFYEVGSPAGLAEAATYLPTLRRPSPS